MRLGAFIRIRLTMSRSSRKASICAGSSFASTRSGWASTLPAEHAFGHVDAPMMGRISTSGLDDYPPVGSVLVVRVLGYSGTSQLRLAVTG